VRDRTRPGARAITDHPPEQRERRWRDMPYSQL
jgi:hypothetical protein